MRRRADGVEFYFPPLRTPAAAVALGAFGILCIVMPAASIAGLVQAGGHGAHGMLVIVLISTFIAPFLAFGAAFVVLALHMLANSFTVRVGATRITTVRRVFGMALQRREMRSAEIAEIEPRIPARYQRLFSSAPCYELIARSRLKDAPAIVVAESLEGEPLMARVKTLIADAAGLPAFEGSASGPQQG